MLGRVVDHYEILARIGSGAMGEVYRARDTRLDRLVALKFLPALDGARVIPRERFHREALAASRLDHPAICTVYDLGTTDDGRPYICMAYCEGRTLAQRIADGPLTVGEAAHVAEQVAAGLACAHAAGIVHRDLKPANIMLTAGGRAKIVDFGLARLADRDQLTADGTLLGTVSYMSPEQALGLPVDHRTDIWSLGVVLYEMIAGTVPFQAPSLPRLAELIARGPAPPLMVDGSPAPPAAASVVARCLAKEPDHRFQDAGELADVLVALASRPPDAGTAVAARTAILPRTALRRSWHRRRRTWAGLLAAAMALAVWVGWRAWTGGDVGHGIAVLPVAVVGGAAEDTALADGLTYLLTTRLMDLEPFQDEAWTASMSELRSREILGTEEARSRLGVPTVVTGMLHLQGELLRLELRRQSTAPVSRMRWGESPAMAVVTGSRRDLVSWTDEAQRALNDLLGWTAPEGDRTAPPGWGTRVSAALAEDLRGCGRLMPLRGEQDLAAARDHLAAAVALDSTFARARAHLAAAIWRGGPDGDRPDPAAALTMCRIAAAEAPDVAEVQYLLGRIQQDLGRPTEAQASLNRCLELVPDHWPARYHLARLHADAGRPERAESTLRRAVADRPGCASALNALGRVLTDRGKLTEAAACYEQVVELTPGNAEGFSNLGTVRYHQGRLDAAAAMWQVALDLHPEAITYQNLGSLYFFQERYLDAARMYHAAAELTPGDHTSFGYAAECYLWSGRDPERARALYARAAELAAADLASRPGDTELAASLASYEAKLGHAAAARKLIAPIVASGPTDGYRLYQIATIHEDLGDRAAALRCLEQALRAGYSRDEIESYPGLDRLRRDPAFADMVSRLDGTGAPGPAAGH